jgi:cytochrome b involved in lipid metabolism
LCTSDINGLAVLTPLEAHLKFQMSATKSVKRAEALLSRREVEGLIANGKAIIIVDQKVLKVDPWMKYHPGGQGAIRHMIGKDATDEVNAFVCHFPDVLHLD